MELTDRIDIEDLIMQGTVFGSIICTSVREKLAKIFYQYKTYYTSTRATYAAKTNALYIFPGWLKHSVQGNFSETDRISISFNYGEKQ